MAKHNQELKRIHHQFQNYLNLDSRIPGYKEDLQCYTEVAYFSVLLGIYIKIDQNDSRKSSCP